MKADELVICVSVGVTMAGMQKSVFDIFRLPSSLLSC